MSRSYVENLVSFISNMRIGQDEGGEPIVSLIPFQVGDILSNGDKIHFDTSKVNDFASYLNTVGANDYLILLDYGDHSLDHALPLFFVVDLSEMGATGKMVLSYNEQPIFSTYEGEVEGIHLVYGFQNLDENDDFELQDLGEYNEKPIFEINDTTPPTWNGVIIGKGEQYGNKLYRKNNTFYSKYENW